jgi:Tfp pilus assembly protein PilF
MDDFNRLRGAVNGSVELWKLGQHQKALTLLDDAIAETIEEGGHCRSISTLCHHAAILCRSSGDFISVKRYYEQSLQHGPQNPLTLYGLAQVALEQGEVNLAKHFAKRSYVATVQGSDDWAKRRLLDLIVKQWPDVGLK